MKMADNVLTLILQPRYEDNSTKPGKDYLLSALTQINASAGLQCAVASSNEAIFSLTDKVTNPTSVVEYITINLRGYAWLGRALA